MKGKVISMWFNDGSIGWLAGWDYDSQSWILADSIEAALVIPYHNLKEYYALLRDDVNLNGFVSLTKRQAITLKGI